MKYNNSTSANFLVSAEMFDKLKNKTDKEGNYIVKRDDVIDGYTILNHEVNIVKCLDEEDGIIFADLVNGYLAEVSEDFHLTTEQHGMYLKGKVAGRIVDYDCIVVAQ